MISSTGGRSRPVQAHRAASCSSTTADGDQGLAAQPGVTGESIGGMRINHAAVSARTRVSRWQRRELAAQNPPWRPAPGSPGGDQQGDKHRHAVCNPAGASEGDLPVAQRGNRMAGAALGHQIAREVFATAAQVATPSSNWISSKPMPAWAWRAILSETRRQTQTIMAQSMVNEMVIINANPSH